MKTRLAILLAVLSISALIFVWGATNYVVYYSDTPGANPELYVRNVDAFAIPAVVTAFVIIGVIPAIAFVIIKKRKLRIVFVPMSGVIIFFVFVLILQRIIGNGS